MEQMIVLSNKKCFSEMDLIDLFHSVNWDMNTPPNILLKGMLNSTHIISAWDGKKLVGIVRCMDDAAWSANIDCLVVHKDYQNKGIGTDLLNELLKNIRHILCISVAPNEKKNVSFYQKFGFTKIEGSMLLQMYANK